MNKKADFPILREVFYVVFAFFLLVFPFNLWAMFDKEDLPCAFRVGSILQEIKKEETIVEEKKDLLSSLSTSLHLAIIDCLDYKDCFQLARTSLQNLFLWGSVSRVPEPFTLEAPNQTTAFQWSGEWPEQATSSLAIEVTQNIKWDELRKLQILKNLNTVSHLCFFSYQAGLEINAKALLLTPPILFPNLISVTLDNVIFGTFGYSVLNLQQLVVRGPFPKWKRDIGRYIYHLTRHGKNLPYLLLEKTKLSHPEEMRAVLQEATLSSTDNIRTIEVKDEEIDPDYLLSSSDFRLKPWIVCDQGIRISSMMREGFPFIIPGPSRVTYIALRRDENQEVLPFQELLSMLFKEGISLRNLFPILKARTTLKRSGLLAQLLRESKVYREGGRIVIDRSSSPQLSSFPILSPTVRVAASRHSAEIEEVKTEDLLNFIRDQAELDKENTYIQSFIADLPEAQYSWNRLILWFRDILEFFESGENENQELSQPNHAEVLVGSIVMDALRYSIGN